MPRLRRKQQAPKWAIDHLRTYQKLHQMSNAVARLDTSGKGHNAPTPTDEQLQELDIELHPLDYNTGATSSAMTPYFTPNAAGLFEIAKTGIDPNEDAFAKHNSGRSKRSFDDSHGPECLCWAVHSYCAVLDSQRPSHVRPTSLRAPGYKQGALGSVRALAFKVMFAYELGRNHQSHRLIFIEATEYADEHRPSAGDIYVLISWMKSAMYHQLKTVKCLKRSDTPRPSTFHVTFPVLVVSFARPATVRVLYGYFDRRLKIAHTASQDFSGPNYAEAVNALLRWCFPILHGNTRISASLPPIVEDIDAAGGESPVPAAEGRDNVHMTAHNQPSPQVAESSSQSQTFP